MWPLQQHVLGQSLRHIFGDAPCALTSTSELLSHEESEALGMVWFGSATADSSHDSLPVPNGDRRLEYSEGLRLCNSPWCCLAGVQFVLFHIGSHLTAGLHNRTNPLSDLSADRRVTQFLMLCQIKKHHHHRSTCTCNLAPRPQCVQHATSSTPSTCEAQT